MVSYLLDTNHWSYLQRGDLNVLARLQALPEETLLFMPVVAQAELLAGVELAAEGRRKQELRQLYQQVMMDSADVLTIDSAVAERFALVFAQLQRAGRPIDTNDIWIASIALVRDLTVVSNDEHFHYVDGLRVEDWTKPHSE